MPVQQAAGTAIVTVGVGQNNLDAQTRTRKGKTTTESGSFRVLWELCVCVCVRGGTSNFAEGAAVSVCLGIESFQGEQPGDGLTDTVTHVSTLVLLKVSK